LVFSSPLSRSCLISACCSFLSFLKKSKSPM
jgi:hypothetical protein